MKKLRLAAVLAGAAVTASCGGTDETQDTVRFWHAMGGPLGRALDGLVEDYNAGPGASDRWLER